MAGDADLLILDNVTDLFSYEYSGEERAPARGRELTAHMREISRWAIASDAAVMVANTVRQAGDGNVESMRRVVDLYTHVKLRLSGGPEYTAECGKWDATVRFGYTIHAGGLRSGRVSGHVPRPPR
jgi:DNA repair protein RAD51